MNISPKEYEQQVRARIASDEMPADIIEDINSVFGSDLIQNYYVSEFTVTDAVRSLYLTSDSLNEDYAIREQNKLTEKYKKCS
jgi:hypothetical protein